MGRSAGYIAAYGERRRLHVKMCRKQDTCLCFFALYWQAEPPPPYHLFGALSSILGVSSFAQLHATAATATTSTYCLYTLLSLGLRVLPFLRDGYVFFPLSKHDATRTAATMASGDVDLCLVPESPIVLEGPSGCIPHLMKRVSQTHT